jgi:uncharacterized protein
MRLLLFVVFFFGGCAISHAASFDCAKARSLFATTVCGDPVLSADDDDLAKAAAVALKGFSPSAKAELSKAEDAWVGFAQIACTQDAKPASTPYGPSGKNCLHDLFESRIRQLQNNKHVGGLHFYYVDRFEADSNQNFPQMFGAGTDVSSAPRLDSTDPFAKVFNKALENTNGLQKLIEEDPQRTDGDGDVDVTETQLVTAVSPSLITITDEYYAYARGADGDARTTYIHFLRDQKRPLEELDIFGGAGWQPTLEKLALDLIKQQVKYPPDFPLPSTKEAIDPSRWNFRPDGLHIQFEPNEVADAWTGPVAVTISWSELEPYLAPGATELIGNVQSIRPAAAPQIGPRPTSGCKIPTGCATQLEGTSAVAGPVKPRL